MHWPSPPALFTVLRLIHMDRVKRSRIGQFNAHIKCAQIENSLSYCVNACNLSRSELAFSYVTNRSKKNQAIRVKNGTAYRVIWAVYFLRYLWLHGKEKPKFKVYRIWWIGSYYLGCNIIGRFISSGEVHRYIDISMAGSEQLCIEKLWRKTATERGKGYRV